MPIIVRSYGKGRGTRYQIISGFRRTTAVRDLGFEAIPAVVRTDLEDDEEAFRASVLENTQRKTYSDIDRALVIRGYDERGHTGREIAEVLGLTRNRDYPTIRRTGYDVPAVQNATALGAQ